MGLRLHSAPLGPADPGRLWGSRCHCLPPTAGFSLSDATRGGGSLLSPVDTEGKKWTQPAPYPISLLMVRGLPGRAQGREKPHVTLLCSGLLLPGGVEWAQLHNGPTVIAPIGQGAACVCWGWDGASRCSVQPETLEAVEVVRWKVHPSSALLRARGWAVCMSDESCCRGFLWLDCSVCGPLAGGWGCVHGFPGAPFVCVCRWPQGWSFCRAM